MYSEKIFEDFRQMQDRIIDLGVKLNKKEITPEQTIYYVKSILKFAKDASANFNCHNLYCDLENLGKAVIKDAEGKRFSLVDIKPSDNNPHAPTLETTK